jgi:hypothetical protein
MGAKQHPACLADRAYGLRPGLKPSWGISVLAPGGTEKATQPPAPLPLPKHLQQQEPRICHRGGPVQAQGPQVAHEWLLWTHTPSRHPGRPEDPTPSCLLAPNGLSHFPISTFDLVGTQPGCPSDLQGPPRLLPLTVFLIQAS